MWRMCRDDGFSGFPQEPAQPWQFAASVSPLPCCLQNPATREQGLRGRERSLGHGTSCDNPELFSYSVEAALLVQTSAKRYSLALSPFICIPLSWLLRCEEYQSLHCQKTSSHLSLCLLRHSTTQHSCLKKTLKTKQKKQTLSFLWAAQKIQRNKKKQPTESVIKQQVAHLSSYPPSLHTSTQAHKLFCFPSQNLTRKKGQIPNRIKAGILNKQSTLLKPISEWDYVSKGSITLAYQLPKQLLKGG